jgi:uncharacterized membrane protein (UPF0127 family)
MRKPWIALLLALVSLCPSCKKAPDAVAGPQGLPTEAQPRLQTMKLWLGAEEMDAELALTGRQQEIGMMFRTNMAEKEGMLFPLPYTTRASFWMMNCPLPLSAAYIDPGGTIREIHNFEPHNTNAVVSEGENIRFVLETPQGWFQRHNVNTGAVVRTERGSLMETFFPAR